MAVSDQLEDDSHPPVPAAASYTAT